ncbi:winged helix-turn-helix transcriptional regulator [Cohnella zeiphila]|uniref:Helix-turn-helix transcriptional regulator n=1 Tax=Cohnella zeiphila TaxID=2761120 RepID=A0A7X0SSL2_9BACL|nr:helix-turn-helix domain-containing protein [Cohnella zeiphila]MBB6735388.1 helix-turn-helix transcriptional regulator [Cohnella zeiphila]
MNAWEETITLDHDDSDELCPIVSALEVIGTKWTFFILRELLLEGTRRFGDLLRAMDGISPKTLSVRLRELEDRGIVSRTVYAEVPPRVEYTLTELGKRLEGIFLELKRFGLLLEEK